MLEVTATAIFGLLLIVVLIGVIADSAWLSLWLVEPATRLIQRIVFGIGTVRAGPEALVESNARVQDQFFFNPETRMNEGYVVIDGERWKACSVEQIEKLEPGQSVRVLSRRGVVLEVAVLNSDLG